MPRSEYWLVVHYYNGLVRSYDIEAIPTGHFPAWDYWELWQNTFNSSKRLHKQKMSNYVSLLALGSFLNLDNARMIPALNHIETSILEDIQEKISEILAN